MGVKMNHLLQPLPLLRQHYLNNKSFNQKIYHWMVIN